MKDAILPTARTMTAIQDCATDGTPPRALRLLLLFTVFYIPNQAHFPDFHIAGVNITNVLMALIFILVLRNRDKAPTPAPLKKSFGFFFLVLFWGFVVGRAHGGTRLFADLQDLKNSVLYMLLFFLAYHAVRDRNTMRLLLLAILFTTFIDIYLGLRQAQDYGFDFNVSRRVAAPFSWDPADANRSSAYYTLYLTLMAVVALYGRNIARSLRWGLLLIVAFGIFVDFFTYSRQSYGILAVLALLLAFRRHIALGLVVVAALLAYKAWLPDPVVARIDSAVAVQTMPGVVARGTSTQQLAKASDQRFLIWSAAGKLIEGAPWGIGLNHFTRDIGRYAPAAAFQDANNYYVLCATEDGVLAPVAMLVLLWGLYRLGRSVRKLDDSPESQVYGLGLELCTLVIVLVNLYGSRFVDGNLMSNFWIFAGFTARYRSILLASRARTTGVGSTPARALPRRDGPARPAPMGVPSATRLSATTASPFPRG
ncbi:MAG: hypothetical protein HIU89_14955 [Proteobacteria bacterium]|nr:hypothetical protein [Pseudomonadota bacterium]